MELQLDSSPTYTLRHSAARKSCHAWKTYIEGLRSASGNSTQPPPCVPELPDVVTPGGGQHRGRQAASFRMRAITLPSERRVRARSTLFERSAAVNGRRVLHQVR
jgi:hypothetical protein